MAKLNLDYYGGEDLYSDGDVENEILEIVKQGIDPEKIEQIKFPVLYHLSEVRENILNWYPFEPEGTCLEIGSGCGAITGLLCRSLSYVTSVELSKRRAEINFVRHKALENLEIRVGNLNDMKFAEGFDYVILNGVFEYAMSFTAGERPYETFLSNVKRFLKPGGILLIAIENRLGIKYLAGAPEDHTDAYFDGIKGYPGNHSVRTFSKSEWEELMRCCGLPYYRFYYPYPDYKFPKEVFTDDSMEYQKYGRPSWNFTRYRMNLFDENQMAGTLQKEGIMEHFANSFLIEMSEQPICRYREILYAKLGTDRAEQYRIATVIRKDPEGRKVIKKALTFRSAAHIQSMEEHQQRINEEAEKQGGTAIWRLLPGSLERDQMIYPFLEYPSLAQQAEQAIRGRDMKKIHALLQKTAVLCGMTDQEIQGIKKAGKELSDSERASFEQVFGDCRISEEMVCISPANIDLILDNIFETEQGYQVIDGEWIFDFPVPCSFLFWRAVNELYCIDPVMEQMYARTQLLTEYGISEECSEVFRDWATHFAEHYVGANRLLNRSIPYLPVSLEQYRRQVADGGQLACTLYVDTGSGFSEHQKIDAKLQLTEGEFRAEFCLKDYTSIKALRFDPIEGNPCICRIDREKSTLRLSAENAAARVEAGDLFLTSDPIYLTRQMSHQEREVICGRLKVLSPQEALQKADVILRGKITSKLAFWR